MPERVLHLACDRGPTDALDELLSLEGVQQDIGLGAEAPSIDSSAQPEDLADDGGILKQRLLGRRKPHEPSGDDPVNRVRQLVDRADSVSDRANCSAYSGLPAAREQRLARRSVERSLEHGGEDRLRLGVREGLQRDGERVRLAATPARPSCEQPGRVVQRTSRGCRQSSICELVDEIEQRVVRPVNVLEHEHQRTIVREQLEEPSPRGE